MLKFENTARVGDIIKAFNFEPFPSRGDNFLVGVVRERDVIAPSSGAKCYVIKVTKCSHGKSLLGELVCVPYETSMDFDKRVQKIGTEAGGIFPGVFEECE